jgi:cytidylate kinase
MADVGRIAALARRLPLTLQPARDGALRVLLAGVDVTRQIRTEEVTETAALISQHPAVRRAMVRCQRALAHVRGVVAEGRDTGSVVFPRAPYKFFLEATAPIRARRRRQELTRLHGYRLPLAQVEAQLHVRDGLDLMRRVGPLVRPRGAVVIDTSRRSPAQVVRAMLRRLPAGARQAQCASSSRGSATRPRS